VIPISTVRLGPEVEQIVLQVIRSGVIAQGPLVRQLEEQFAALSGAKHAVAVNNGTTSLVAALQALGLGPGDEVVTSPFTFVATINAILESGATARFADIQPADFCIDPDAVDAAVTERTAAVMPVHLYGQCADMTRIMRTANRLGLSVVEDAAQAHGATVDGRSAGTFGIGSFSFYATKNLTTGEGGMITTSDDVLADRLRVMRNQGMRERYQYEMAGHNYRLTDLQAALALPQIAGYPQALVRRRANAAKLNAGLADVAGLTTPAELPGRSHVWHQYTVLLDEDAPVTRDEFVSRLTDLGIGSGIYYPRVVFDYECYRAHPRVVAEPMPVAESVARRCVSLPVHPHLSDVDVEKIIAGVREVMKA
jgi:perosamine synthetase